MSNCLVYTNDVIKYTLIIGLIYTIIKMFPSQKMNNKDLSLTLVAIIFGIICVDFLFKKNNEYFGDTDCRAIPGKYTNDPYISDNKDVFGKNIKIQIPKFSDDSTIQSKCADKFIDDQIKLNVRSSNNSITNTSFDIDTCKKSCSDLSNPKQIRNCKSNCDVLDDRLSDRDTDTEEIQEIQRKAHRKRIKEVKEEKKKDTRKKEDDEEEEEEAEDEEDEEDEEEEEEAEDETILKIPDRTTGKIVKPSISNYDGDDCPGCNKNDKDDGETKKIKEMKDKIARLEKQMKSKSDYDKSKRNTPADYYNDLINELTSKGILTSDDVDNLNMKIKTGLFTYDDVLPSLQKMKKIGKKVNRNTNTQYSELPADFYSPLGDKELNKWDNTYTILDTNKWQVPVARPPVCINTTPCKVCPSDVPSYGTNLGSWDDSRVITNTTINQSWAKDQASA
jgi:hypothetical protein